MTDITNSMVPQLTQASYREEAAHQLGAAAGSANAARKRSLAALFRWQPAEPDRALSRHCRAHRARAFQQHSKKARGATYRAGG